MAKHLNPLEKEFLIRRYRSNQRISIKDFCESNGITDTSLKKWMKQYDEGGLEAPGSQRAVELPTRPCSRLSQNHQAELLAGPVGRLRLTG